MCDFSKHFEVKSAASALILAVNEGDFEGLISLSETPEIGNIRDSCGDTLIHLAVSNNDIEILEHLLNLKTFDLDIYNKLGKTPLLIAACHSDPACAKLLIEKGANVNLTDSEGNTPLHYSVYYDFRLTSVILLEKGADVNIVNERGFTVLHVVCDTFTDLEPLCMLLYYGSDPNLRSFENRHSPFEVCLETNKVAYQGILQDYVIHELDKIPISLEALLPAMKDESPFINSVMDNISVDFGRYCWCHFVANVMYCRAEYLRKFFERFFYVLEELTCKENDWHEYLMRRVFPCGLKLPEKYHEVLDSLYVIYAEPVVYFFLEEVDPFDKRNFINDLIYIWLWYKLDRKPLSEVVLHMLSMGAQLTDSTLSLIYLNYGDTEFFRILLHMDIHTIMADHSYSGVPIPAIIHETKWTTVDAFIPWKSNVTCVQIEILANFFADARIKDFLMNSKLDKYKVKGGKIPEVPLLVELARNATRKHLIDFYKVRNSRQFYTILNWLPLCREHKAIIGLQRRLYCLD